MRFIMMTADEIIDRYYPADINPQLRDIYLRHARQVADFALAVNSARALGLDPEELRAAALLHDIGIFATDAPGIHCHGDAPYMQHGIIGARLLREIGAPEEWARVAERHTGTGLTAEDIEMQQLPLPPADYMPESLLEKLVCYADKFYSKNRSMDRKAIDRVRASVARHGGDSLTRFDDMYAFFGEPGPLPFD